MGFDIESFREWVESPVADEIPFDAYAQNPNDWGDLTALIPGLVVTSAGGIAVYQAEGLLCGLPFYFKARDNTAILRVGSTDDLTPYLPETALYVSDSIPCNWSVTRDEFKQLMVTLVPTLRRAETLWVFPAKELEFVNGSWTGGTTSKDTVVYGWGYTPEEGYKAATRPSEYLISKGFSVERQQAMFEAQQVSPEPSPLTVTKTWPVRDPDFTVD